MAPSFAATEARYSPAVVREVEARAATIEGLLAADSEELALVRRLRTLVRARTDQRPSPSPTQRPSGAFAPDAGVSALAAAYPDEGARRELTFRLDAPETHVRVLAVQALARWSEAGPDLALHLEREQDRQVRRAVLRALGEHGGPDALGALLAWIDRPDLARSERDEAVTAAQRVAARSGQGPLSGLPLTRRKEARAAAAAAPRVRAPRPERLRGSRRGRR